MLALSVHDSDLVVTLGGLSRLWALSGDLRIPLASISTVRVYRGEPSPWTAGARLGTAVPALFLAGRCWQPRYGASFWYLKRRDRAIYLEVETGPYRRLVLDAPDPGAAVATIQAARNAARSAAP